MLAADKSGFAVLLADVCRAKPQADMRQKRRQRTTHNANSAILYSESEEGFVILLENRGYADSNSGCRLVFYGCQMRFGSSHRDNMLRM